MTVRERFAPSPTGPLHLGHAYSAMLAHDAARAAGGAFLLRIEDIDRARSRDVWIAQIFNDLAWLGLSWETPVLYQSTRMAAYTDALAQLTARGLTYACQCNRKDVLAAVNAPQEGAPMGPDGVIYPGTCRELGLPPENAVIRLNMAKAVEAAGNVSLGYTEIELGHQQITTKHLIENVGDIVLARKDMGTSYHLSVVVDDAYQEISHVTRGEDLREATAIHVILQALLNLPIPIYRHHRLIRDETGKRLAKRDNARAIAKFRSDGWTAEDVRREVGL